MSIDKNEYTIKDNKPNMVGYGDSGNFATYYMFKHLLTPEEAEEYRSELKKKDKKAYNGYLEFEKLLDETEKDYEKYSKNGGFTKW